MSLDIREFEIRDGMLVKDVTSYKSAVEALAFLNIKEERVRSQIDEAIALARETGEFSDDDWFRRAKVTLGLTKTAKRFVSDVRNQLLSQRSKFAKLERGRAHDNKLIRALRDHVGDETFLRIAKQVEDDVSGS